MVFTIEPCIGLGDRTLDMADDGWTLMTADDSRTAQFEETVLITNDGVEVLTK